MERLLEQDERDGKEARIGDKAKQMGSSIH